MGTTPLLRILLLYLLCASAWGVVTYIEDDSDFDCSLLSHDYLAGDDALVQAIQQACQNDVHCAAWFAQEQLGDLTTFKYLLQATDPHPSQVPLAWQSPMFDVVCGKSLNDALAAMWVRSLVVGIRRLDVCATGEELQLMNGGSTAQCHPKLRSTYNSPGNYYGTIIAMNIVIVVIGGCLVLLLAYRFWKNKDA